MTFREKLQARAKKNLQAKAIKKFGPYDIILAPVITEKSHKQQADENKYAFKVHDQANKNDVKQAIEYIYKVTPLTINMVNVVYKWRTQRALVRKSYKKAIVTLGKKDKIEVGV